MIKKQYRNTILIWLILAIITFALLGTQISRLPKYFKLTLTGVQTQGFIIKLEPTHHRAVYYSYEVGGRSYTDTFGGAGSGNPKFEDIKIGDPVLVYYLPENPSISGLGDPSYKFITESISVLTVSMVVPAIIIFFIWFNFIRKST
ncbi:DUF3592 domain-containing protein [Syntrophaceticus schinkii]|jgi:hypothetical protein|uniref:DUF3592 domain-containing protein n=1 Tax=Syntrophaceticus schinkii TaxID=499207 RepID=A0A0B7MCT7_9FIRM|nr:DUF3592 domain-containing protein [Syntrophaceticus schinkii]MDD2359879.1 DUF3592 domain-containing protein [Syntrophaceticus schinkii]CEO87885.1 exported hypothetical protein [Syntrophaceticus schinkii]